MPSRRSPLHYIFALGAVATLGWSFLATGAARAQGQVEVDTALVFAVDISRSMDRPEQELQRNGYVQALKSPQFIDALKASPLGKIAIAYVEWSGAEDQEILLKWTLIDGADTANAAADKLAAAPYRSASRTSISGGIDFAAQLFGNSGFKGDRKVIDVSGDGPNNSGRMVTEARADALAKGITINGLPLVGIRPYRGFGDIANLDLYYKNCVIGGDGAFMVAVHDTKDFVTATRIKLVREIAMRRPSMQALPVQLAQDKEPPMSCSIGEDRGYRGGYYFGLPQSP